MEERQIDWPNAVVRAHELVVPLTGKNAKPWRERFLAVLARLQDTAREAWDVRLARDEVHVKGITPGEEPGVHHLLESVVLEANAAVPSPEEGDETSQADREMTEAFRSLVASDTAA
jgi:hypothetical protein